MKTLVLAGLALTLGLQLAQARDVMSEKQAMAKAVAVLTGDPYGATPAETRQNIKQSRFVRDGVTQACGARKAPAWEFHVVVVTANKDQFKNGVIDGFLALDARTGKILCANLPLLE